MPLSMGTKREFFRGMNPKNAFALWNRERRNKEEK